RYNRSWSSCPRSSRAHPLPVFFFPAFRGLQFLDVIFLQRTAHRRQRKQFEAVAPQHFECRILLLFRQYRVHHVAAEARLDPEARQPRRHSLRVKNNLDFAARLRSQFRYRPHPAQFTLVYDPHPVAKRLRIRENVGRKENRLAFGAQLLDQIPDLAPPHRVQPRHRLIQKHQLRIVQDRLRQPQSLQHALGELPQLHPRRIAQSYPFEHLLHPRRAPFCRKSRKLPIIVEQFSRAQMVVEVGLLGQKSNLRFHPRIVHIQPQNPRGSSGREYQPHQELEGGGLARAIRTEEAEHLSLFDRQAERTQREFRPLAPESDEIAFFQVENLNCSHGYARNAKPLARNLKWNPVLMKRIISNAGAIGDVW